MTTSIRAQTVAATVDLLYLEVLVHSDRDEKLADAIVSDAYYHFERHPQITWISRWLN